LIGKANNHSYDLDVISKAVDMVVKNHSSLRGAAANLSLFMPEGEKSPVHSTIHNWIMKIGVASYLRRPTGRSYHAFVVDATINYGALKLLLVLGIRSKDVKSGFFAYSHNDVDVLKIIIPKRLDGDAVFDVLKECANKHGAPAQIIADGGGDIKKGIKKFTLVYDKTVYTYDVTHKCALILKHFLNNDADWKRFYAMSGETRRNLLQTELFCYAPPKTRDKSRHLNLDSLVEWAENLLYARKQKANRKSEKFTKAFGWIDAHTKKIKLWRQILDLIKFLKTEVVNNGIGGETLTRFKMLTAKHYEKIPSKLQKIYDEMIEYVNDVAAYVPSGESWPACSDVIESIFGKYKTFAKQYPFREITRMIMTIPIFTCKEIKNKLKRFLEHKTTKFAYKWIKNNIGESMQFKRRNAFRIRRINKC
jgi:hypothetical protein